MALTTSEGAAEMTRAVKVVRGTKTLAALPLRADTHRNTEDSKDGAARFPANSLLATASK